MKRYYLRDLVISAIFSSNFSSMQFLKRSQFKPLIILLGLFIMASCEKHGGYINLGQVNDDSYEELGMIPVSSQSTGEPQAITYTRKIIKEGNIRFETTDAEKTKNSLLELVASHEGFISQENADTYENISGYTITVRIPAAYFDQLLEKIILLTKKIDEQNISSLDVTEEFIDVNSRITTKKALESRYKEILKQATSVEDILKIEKEIGILRTEIESIEGRLNYLKNQTFLSTLVVYYYEKSNSYGVGTTIGEAFTNGWNNLLSFLIWLINLWPFVLMAFLAIIAIFRLRKRRNSSN